MTALLASFTAAACKEAPQHVGLTDTEGRTFRAECRRDTCSYQRVDAAPVAPHKKQLVLHTSGRLVGICDVSGDTAPDPGDCRALTCQSDRDCPPQHGLEAGHCLNGLCIAPDQPLGAPDAVLLCLAGSGLGRKAPKQVERYAMAMNCGTPCRVPAPCRQP